MSRSLRRQRLRGEKNGAERPAHPGSHGDTLPRPRRANPGGPRADTPPALAGSVQAGIQPLAPRSRRESRGGAGPARSGAPSPGPGAWGGAAGTCMQQGTGRGGGRRRGRAGGGWSHPALSDSPRRELANLEPGLACGQSRNPRGGPALSAPVLASPHLTATRSLSLLTDPVPPWAAARASRL